MTHEIDAQNGVKKLGPYCTYGAPKPRKKEIFICCLDFKEVVYII